jgi:hypothetical protein
VIGLEMVGLGSTIAEEKEFKTAAAALDYQ